MSFKNIDKTGEYVKYLNMKINSKHFLRSLYFRLNQLEDEKYSITISKALEVNVE